MNYDLVIHVNANDPAVLELAFSQAANYQLQESSTCQAAQNFTPGDRC